MTLVSTSYVVLREGRLWISAYSKEYSQFCFLQLWNLVSETKECHRQEVVYICSAHQVRHLWFSCDAMEIASRFVRIYTRTSSLYNEPFLIKVANVVRFDFHVKHELMFLLFTFYALFCVQNFTKVGRVWHCHHCTYVVSDGNSEVMINTKQPELLWHSCWDERVVVLGAQRGNTPPPQPGIWMYLRFFDLS
jgi:hypothetical protein